MTMDFSTWPDSEHSLDWANVSCFNECFHVALELCIRQVVDLVFFLSDQPIENPQRASTMNWVSLSIAFPSNGLIRRVNFLLLIRSISALCLTAMGQQGDSALAWIQPNSSMSFHLSVWNSYCFDGYETWQEANHHVCLPELSYAVEEKIAPFP